MSESLVLKWGTLKGWNVETERAQDILVSYHKIGASVSCMAQKDTPEQKRLLCELIDAIDGEIHNDWSGETMTKEQAKDYVTNYGRRAPA